MFVRRGRRIKIIQASRGVGGIVERAWIEFFTPRWLHN